METAREAKFKAAERGHGDRAAHKLLDWYQKNHGLANIIEIATVLRHLGANAGDVVLDAGCGVGRLTLPLAERVRSVIAVDITPGYVETLERYAADAGYTNITATCSDLSDLPVDAGTIDKAVAIEVLQHVPSQSLRADAVRRLHQCLRPGGRIIVVGYRWGGAIRDVKEGTHDDGRYRIADTPEEARALLENAGFRKVRVTGCINMPFRTYRWKRLAWLVKMLDVMLSHTTISARMGTHLLASGVR